MDRKPSVYVDMLRARVKELHNATVELQEPFKWINSCINDPDAVIPPGMMERVEDLLAAYQNGYAKLEEVYKELFDKDFDIKNLKDIEEEIASFDKEFQIRDEAEALLKSYRELVAEGEEAKKNLEAAISRIEAIIEQDDLEAVATQLEPYRILLNLVKEIDTINPAELVTAATALESKIDGSFLMSALFFKKYHFAANQTEDPVQETEDEPVPEEISEAETKEESEKVENQEDPAETEKPVDTVTEPVENKEPQDDSSNEEEKTEEEKESARIFEIFKKNNAFVSEETVALLKTDLSAKAAKKFGVSEFKKMHSSKGPFNAYSVKFIVNIVATCGYISNKCPGLPKENTISGALSMLHREGYLLKCSMYDDEVYLPTQKFQSCASNVEVRRQLEIKHDGLKIHFFYQNIYNEHPNNLILASMCIEKLERCFDAPLYNEKEKHTYSTNRNYGFGHYIGRPEFEDVKSRVLFASCAVVDVAEVGPAFIISLKEYLESAETSLFIFFGVSSEHTENMVRTILESVPELNEVKEFVFASLEEDALYHIVRNGNENQFELLDPDRFNALVREACLERTPAAADAQEKAVSKEESRDVLQVEPEHEEVFEENVPEPEPEPEKKENNDEVASKEEPNHEPKQEHVPKSELEPSSSEEETVLPEIKEDEQEVFDTILPMIIDGKSYAASAYLNSRKFKGAKLKKLATDFAYAKRDPAYHIIYSLNNQYDHLSDVSDIFGQYLFVASSLRTMFVNQGCEYGAVAFFDNFVKNLPILEADLELKSLFFEIATFSDKVRLGFDRVSDYKQQNRKVIDQRLTELQSDAAILYDALFVQKATEHTTHRRFIETKNIIFNIHGDLADLIHSVAVGDCSMLVYIDDYLKQTFLKDGCEVSFDNLDNDKLSNFIDASWDKAGEAIFYLKHDGLVSSLRQNLIKNVEKVIRVLCDWSFINSKRNSDANGFAETLYKNKRQTVLNSIEKSISFQSSIQKNAKSKEEKAGAQVLKETLQELQAKITGNYEDHFGTDYYIDFLKTPQVVLDGEYTPVYYPEYRQVGGLSDEDRIKDHLSEMAKKNCSFEERLSDIFLNKGDDYGSAEQIRDFLGWKFSDIDNSENYDFEDSKARAAAGVEKDKKAFIENLELAQSYGQIIASSSENTKEKILQLVDDAFMEANITGNFGFFRKVTGSFLSQIRKDSIQREETLKKQLEKCIADSEGKEDKETLDRKINLIQKMLDVQNYTVAEDMLSRFDLDESELARDILPIDYLQDFLDNYEVYKNLVSNMSLSLQKQFTAAIRNKDDKGGNQLIEAWLDPTKRYSPQSLERFMDLLGFRVDRVTENSTGGLQTFDVTLKKPEYGGQITYRHPIAALGTEAEQKGLKVVTIAGRTDASRLVENMKTVSGSGKSACILMVDYPLPLPERRKLARKVKEECSDSVYIVIDRVMLMYLSKKYNKELENSIFASLVLPFAYVQPFIYDSAIPVPPEMFMARTRELEMICSPTGASIFVSGRQMGKTGCGRYAKFKIDHNESGDRAVFVDIHNLDYKHACRKVGHALYDEGVLKEDIDTDNWEELARAIKKRLRDTAEPIPYLLLLLDEADTFIASSGEEDVNYFPFDCLKDVQTSLGSGRFKFCVFGLRDVVKFKRDASLSNNSVIAHLGSHGIKPFDTQSARELLETPLYYLGYRWPKDNEALMPLIFSSANYYPGLLQLYGAKLIETIKKDYGGFDQCDTPIYYIREDQIKKILSEESFLQQVYQKYEITLKLGSDRVYYYIALIMAYLYHQYGYRSGYSVETVLKTAEELGNPLRVHSVDSLKCFMDELCDLNVLTKTQDGYLFLRYNFFSLMGTRDSVDDQLLQCMEETK